jgi:pimeloyl-ACP methyl ester carboxylesterase
VSGRVVEQSRGVSNPNEVPVTTASTHFSTRVRRLLASASVLSALVLVPACASDTATTADQDRDMARNQDAGEAEVPDAHESVSDRAVDVYEAGAGAATVVFESGLGNDWTPWRQVADEVAAKARVFAYSRPGYGTSDPTDEPRDATHIVEDLRTLLSTRGYAPPYVLVGHSFGGTYMELFAKAHPEEVAGLVLVDPRHRDFTTACEEAGYAGCRIPEAILSSLPQVQIAEYDAFADSSAEIRAAGVFGRYPVRVLTATSHGFASEPEALWESMLRSLAEEAPDGEQKMFAGASHALPTERPHDVAEAILNIVSAPGI